MWAKTDFPSFHGAGLHSQISPILSHSAPEPSAGFRPCQAVLLPWFSFLLQPCAVIWHLHSHGPLPCLSQPWRTQSSAFPITVSRLLESTGKSTNRANWYHPRFMVPDFSLASRPQWSASVLNLPPLQLPGGPLSHL